MNAKPTNQFSPIMLQYQDMIVDAADIPTFLGITDACVAHFVQQGVHGGDSEIVKSLNKVSDLGMSMMDTLGMLEGVEPDTLGDMHLFATLALINMALQEVEEYLKYNL